MNFLKFIKHIFLFFLTFLLGVQTTYAKTELVLPQNNVSFLIEQNQSFTSIEKEVQPNIGFLKEKSRFVVSEDISAQNQCGFSESKWCELVNAETYTAQGSTEIEDEDGNVYVLSQDGTTTKIDNPIPAEEINKGNFKGQDHIIRYHKKDGVLQVKALGIRKDIEIAGSKTADLQKAANELREETNEFLRENGVSNETATPASQGQNLNAGNQTFADGDSFTLDNNAKYTKIIHEGLSISTELLKTGEIKEDVYLESKKGEVAIHAPGIVTGATEVGVETVTDITSIVSETYKLTTSKDARHQMWEGVQQMANQAQESPEEFFTEFLLTTATYNSSAEWEKVADPTVDLGERSHLGTRGVVGTAKNVFASGGLLAAVNNLGQNVVKVDFKKLLKKLSDNHNELYKKIEQLSNRKTYNLLLAYIQDLPNEALNKLNKNFDEYIKEFEQLTTKEQRRQWIEDNLGKITNKYTKSSLELIERVDLPEFVFNNLKDLLLPENRTIIWSMKGTKRGDLIEEIFNQWDNKYKGYQNLNDIIENYETLDFDGALADINEVVSLKTYKRADNSLSTLKTTLRGYTKKLNDDVAIGTNHEGKSRVLDFVVEKGSLTQLQIDNVNDYIDELLDEYIEVDKIKITPF